MKANSGDPNQTLHSVTSDLGLHYYFATFYHRASKTIFNVKMLLFSHLSILTCALGAQKNRLRLIETVPSTQSISFG